MRIKKELSVGLLGVGLFLVFSTVFIDLPGIHYDEVLFVNASLPGDDGSFVSWSLPVEGRRVPLMLMGYIGAIKAYLYTPVFVLFGRTSTTVRLPVVLIGVGTLLFTYSVVKATLDKRIALTTLLLLASDPSFVFANRLDWGPVSLGLFLKVASLHFLLRWLGDGKRSQLLWASFLMGVGVFDKVTFLWFVAAVILVMPLCYWKRLKPQLAQRTLAVSLGWFVVGCVPFVAYNLRGPGRSFKEQEVLNKSVFESLAGRYKLFKATLNGEAIYGFINGQPLESFGELVHKKKEQNTRSVLLTLAKSGPLNATLTHEVLLLAIGVISCLWLRGRLESRVEVIFFLLLLAIMTILIWATAQATGAHHILSVYPLPHIIISTGIWKMAEIGNPQSGWRGFKLFRGFAVTSIAFLLYTQLVIDARYLISLKINGGVGPWSDAIYELVRYTRQHSDYTYQLMDWGFNNQLRLLGERGLRKTEAFRAVSEAGTLSAQSTAMRDYIARPNSLLVFHAPGWETLPLLDVFWQALSKYKIEAELIKTFYQRDGRPIYLLYRTRNRQFEDYLASGGFFYFREAEEWDHKSGAESTLKWLPLLTEHWAENGGSRCQISSPIALTCHAKFLRVSST